MAHSSKPPADFLTVDPDHHRIFLNVHLQPGAKSSAVTGLHGDALKIRISAPAVDNKANAALVTYLSKLLGVAISKIHIRSGLRSRRKRLEIVDAPDLAIAQLRAAIADLPDPAP
ncbi:MAG: DUF167 domain-containing protein [Burkholderiales bacterium]